MRKINYIALHCSATAQSATVESIKRYWREIKGWKSPGYHYIIPADGELVQLLDYDKISNGVRNYNHETIHICYIGGVDNSNKPIDNRTEEQRNTILKLLKELKVAFPDAIIQGHRDFPKVAKACPSFDAKGEYKLNIMEKNQQSVCRKEMKIDVHCHMFNKKIASVPILLDIIKDILETKNSDDRIQSKSFPNFSHFIPKTIILLKLLSSNHKDELLEYMQKNGEANTIFVPLMFDLKFAVDSDEGVAALRDMNLSLKTELLCTPKGAQGTSTLSVDEQDVDGLSELLEEIDRFIIEKEAEINPDNLLVSKSCGDTFDEQYRQLLDMKNRNKDIIKPFFMVDPRREDVYNLMVRAIEIDGFTGVKMYCPNGYSPLDPRLDRVYKYCRENNIPITAHCSYGGFATLENKIQVEGYIYDGENVVPHNGELTFTKKINKPGGVEERALALNHPDLWKKVLEDNPGLKLNLAHMGIRKNDDLRKRYEWSNLISNMMLEHETLYADFSCLTEKDTIIYLWNLVSEADKYCKFNLKVTDRIMFGTDFWLSMIFKRFDNYIEDFDSAFAGKKKDLDRIQKTNPRRFLNM